MLHLLVVHKMIAQTHVFLLVLATITYVHCANILGVIPSASYSHQIPYRQLWRALHSRGHHLTIITTDPMNDPTLENITEIDTHFSYAIFQKHNYTELLGDENLGAKEVGMKLYDMVTDAVEAQLNLPEVQRLIHNEQVHFDLLMVEMSYPSMLGFSARFHCPWIGLSSLDLISLEHASMGNLVHPVLFPYYNFAIEDPERLTFQERLQSVLFSLGMRYGYYNHYLVQENARLKKFFGDNATSIEEIYQNESAVFIASNQLFHNVRAMVPNVMFLGDGIHIAPPKPLPKDLEQFLNSSNQGVIYFSLGSNVKSSTINQTTIDSILEAFAELPSYKVLWKFELNNTAKVPANVQIGKWFPQQDILRHPNVKLFITQTGLQSLQEALANHVPMVCIPFFGDQLQNAAIVEKKGLCVRLGKKHLTKRNFKAAILEAMQNPKYKENIVKYGSILKDVSMSGVEKAVWWTEYVLRHKGAKHLRSYSADIPMWQYLLLDVVAFVACLLFIFVCLLRILYKLSVRLFINRTKTKIE